MDEETNLEVQEAPEVEVTPETNEVELDEAGNPIAEPEEQDDEPTDDLEDVEIDGKTYKVPKDAALRQADYTRKTQEVADMRRQVEATLNAVRTVSEAEMKARAEIGKIDAQIADYDTIDWDTWDQTDPQAANRAWRHLASLKDSRNGVLQQFATAQQQRTLIEQQETAKRLEQGQRELKAKIPDWSADKARSLRDFGREAYGLADDFLDSITDPRLILVLNDAFQQRKAQKTQQVARKVQPEIKPAAKVSGGKPVLKGLDDRLSTEAWIKAREAQLSRK